MDIQNLDQASIDTGVAKIRHSFLEQRSFCAYDPIEAVSNYQSALDIATDRCYLSVHTASFMAYKMNKALIGGLAS